MSGEFGPRHPTKPKSWDEIFAITGSLKGVPIEEIEVGRIDWEYELSTSDMRKCGRVGCERDHAHGWIVALQGSRYVNIGNDCAHKYANAEKWRSGVTRYKERIRKDARDAAIAEARDEAQKIQYWLDTDPKIEKAISLHQSWTDQTKGSLHNEIVRRAEKGKPEIERARKLSDSQVEQRRVMLTGGRVDRATSPYVATVEAVRVATLAGLDCFKPMRDPAELKRRLMIRAKQLLVTMPHEDEAKKVKDLAAATRELIPLKNALVRSEQATLAFFTPENFAAVMQLEQTRAQGIVSIQLIGEAAVLITRRVNWGVAA